METLKRKCSMASEAIVNWRNYVRDIFAEYFIRHPAGFRGNSQAGVQYGLRSNSQLKELCKRYLCRVFYPTSYRRPWKLSSGSAVWPQKQ